MSECLSCKEIINFSDGYCPSCGSSISGVTDKANTYVDYERNNLSFIKRLLLWIVALISSNILLNAVLFFVLIFTDESSESIAYALVVFEIILFPLSFVCLIPSLLVWHKAEYVKTLILSVVAILVPLLWLFIVYKKLPSAEKGTITVGERILRITTIILGTSFVFSIGALFLVIMLLSMMPLIIGLGIGIALHFTPMLIVLAILPTLLSRGREKSVLIGILTLSSYFVGVTWCIAMYFAMHDMTGTIFSKDSYIK